MSAREPMTFTRSADGTILLRQDDGSYRPVQTATDRAALAMLTEDEIEAMAASDPDHPGLDEAFWSTVEARR